MTSAAAVKHHFTVDVEEYFQVSALADAVWLVMFVILVVFA